MVKPVVGLSKRLMITLGTSTAFYCFFIAEYDGGLVSLIIDLVTNEEWLDNIVEGNV